MKKEPLIVAGCCGVSFLAILTAIGGVGAHLFYAYEQKESLEKEQRAVQQGHHKTVAKAAPQAASSSKTPSRPPAKRRAGGPVARLITNETQAERAAKKAEPLYANALSALNEANYADAGKALSKANGYMTYHKEGIIGDEPAEVWLSAQKKPILKAIDIRMATYRQAMKTGHVNLPELSRFHTAFRYVNSLRDEMIRFRDDINGYLKVYEKTILQVSLSVPNTDYLAPLKEMLRSKYPQKGAYYTLSFNDETRAFRLTGAKRMSVRLRVEQSRYKDQRGRSFYLPRMALFHFAMGGNSTVKTSWDTIKPFTVKAEVPAELSVKAYDQSLAKTFNARLIKAIQAKSSAIPPFSLFPGINTDTLTLVTNQERIDVKSAEILMLLNPARLATLVDEQVVLEQTDQNSLDLCQIIIRNNLTKHIPWVVKKVEATKETRFQELSKAAASRPDFGQYEVIKAMMRKSRDWPLFPAMKRCALADPAALKIFEELCQDRTNKNRASHANSLIVSLPAEKRVNYAAWLSDPTPAFAVSVWNSIADTPTIIESLLLKYHNKADALTQKAMWNSVKSKRVYVKQPYNAALLTLNEKTAISNDKKLAYAARSALVWNLQDRNVLNKTMAVLKRIPKEDRSNFASLIANSTPTKDVALAMTVYTELLNDEQARQHEALEADPKTYRSKLNRSSRKTIIERMLRLKKNGPDVEFYKTMNALYTSFPNDFGLMYDVTRTLQSYLSRGKTDYSNKDLQRIVQAGMASSYSRTRHSCYQVAAKALKTSNDTFYKTSLETAYTVEKDRYAKSYLKGILQK